MKKLTTFLLMAAFITFGLLTTQGEARAKTIELKFGHVGAPGSLFLACADEFAKRANAKLGDQAKVVTFGSSQLGKDQELLKKLKLGTIAFALPSKKLPLDLRAILDKVYVIQLMLQEKNMFPNCDLHDNGC